MFSNLRSRMKQSICFITTSLLSSPGFPSPQYPFGINFEIAARQNAETSEGRVAVETNDGLKGSRTLWGYSFEYGVPIHHNWCLTFGQW